MGGPIPLKPISHEGIPAALEKARRYRLLNHPGQAESICLDVLAIDEDNADALETLILALSDQFPRHLQPAFDRAMLLLPRLPDDYARIYYEGILCERRGKAHFRSGNPMAGAMAFEWLNRAMGLYADEVVLVIHDSFLFETGTFEGKEAVGRWFGDFFASFEDYRFEIDELRKIGDVFFMHANHGGSGRLSGAEVHAETFYLYDVRDGEIVRAELFGTREDALKAAERS